MTSTDALVLGEAGASARAPVAVARTEAARRQKRDAEEALAEQVPGVVPSMVTTTRCPMGVTSASPHRENRSPIPTWKTKTLFV